MNNAKSIKKIFQTYIYACKSLFNFKNTHLKACKMHYLKVVSSKMISKTKEKKLLET